MSTLVEKSADAGKMAPARKSCYPGSPSNSTRVCSVVSLDEREPRAPLRRQLSVDEERGCAGHWGGLQAGGAGRGLRLYRGHLLNTLAGAGLRAPPCALLPVRTDGSWWEWWWDARALSRASRKFARSPQRAALRVRAASVQLAMLDFPTFQHILQTLFQEGGASLERVLALFYFLSDLSCAALRSGLRAHFCRVTGWAARHVAERGAPWVRRHGGWGRVLRQGPATGSDAAALAAVAAACALAAVCLYRLLHRPHAIADC